MDSLAELLALLLAGLTAVLAGVGSTAAVRLRDSRLALVSAGLALLAVVGALAFLHEISPRYGGPFAVDPIPLALALAASLLLYGSLFRARPKPPSP